MKQLLLLSFIFFILASGNLSCSKGFPVRDEAVITGFDGRYCMCCGGLMINFRNDPQPYSEPFYLIENPHTELGIDRNEDFPLYVEVRWKQVKEKCSGKFIRIMDIKRRE